MKWFGYLFSVLCGLLAIEILFSAGSTLLQTPRLTAHDYVTFVQMFVTFITAVLLAVFNFATTRSNEEFRVRLNRESSETLARLQADLQVETSRSVEKIRAEFTTSVNDATERLRSELNRSTEDFKARLGQTVPVRYNGYHAMYKAATKYFFALRNLEKGIYPDDELKQAEVAADEAIGSALIVDPEDRQIFYDFVREALVLRDTARRNQRAEALQDLWETAEGKAIGARYKRLEAAYSVKVRS